ncbi:hypothetical protein EIP86_009155 [Pleurotus ostreatoroseus]|nr:hypothetical protein EIP86_009155 [Pleurotus ostreatoroseus]
MQRHWTDQSREEWVGRRADRRKQKGRSNPARLRPQSLELEKENVREALIDAMKMTRAWEIQKYPLIQYLAPFSGKLFVPLRYYEDDHKHTIKFSKGQDMNVLLYSFYDSIPDPKFTGVNFVSSDGVVSPGKRHEYLGPAPCVAGYRFDFASKTARVEWWDRRLDQMWIGRSTWKIEVYHDEVVGGWVSSPRGDCDEALDLTKYLGL